MRPSGRQSWITSPICDNPRESAPTETGAIFGASAITTVPFIARYLTHPEVRIDPDVPVTGWSLSSEGRARVERLAASGVLNGTRRVISSAETKALQTAAPLAAALGVDVEVRRDMHENDRSATGYLPREEFEATADLFFGQPQASVRGWERAVDAQRRIREAVSACLAEPLAGDVLFVGHGAVGTLLLCDLRRTPIARSFDQPQGGGCVFAFELPDGPVLHGWVRLEALVQA